jgi:hypothetical protein
VRIGIAEPHARTIRAAALAAALLSVCVCVHTGADAQAVYRWVDEHGTVHYSDRASRSDVRKEAVDLPSAPSPSEVASAQFRLDVLKRNVERAQAQRDDARAQARANELYAKAQDVVRERLCNALARDLRVLGLQRPVYYTDDAGQRVFLDDAARAAERAKLQAVHDEHCQPG